MEAVGIAVSGMTASGGWDIQPIGSNATAQDIHKGAFAGIVTVA
jgi:hypothetical protein